MHTFDPGVLIAARTALNAERDTIHVWSFALAGTPECIEICRGWLSAAEAERAGRFIYATHRDEYIVAHGVLRHLLARYLRSAPADLQFGSGPAGKPFLEPASATESQIKFNLTHSGGRALLAVGADRELGVDLERVRENLEALAIARRYFFGSERAAIESAAPERRADTFIRYWAAKEAVLKAQGIGIGFPLDRFEVLFDQETDTARITTQLPDQLSGDWRIRMLPTDAGWHAAVASSADNWKLRLESEPTPRS